MVIWYTLLNILKVDIGDAIMSPSRAWVFQLGRLILHPYLSTSSPRGWCYQRAISM